MVEVADIKTDLRRGFDHIGISVSFWVHDGKGRVLLQKRGPKARDEQGNWDVGGGAIEFGESILKAVKRELKEELQVVPKEIKFLTVLDVLRELNGQKSHWITVLHAVKVDPKEVKIGEPHKIERIDWFNLNNLPKPLHSQFYKAYAVAQSDELIR